MLARVIFLLSTNASKLRLWRYAVWHVLSNETILRRRNTVFTARRECIARTVLGQDVSLSICLCGDRLSHFTVALKTLLRNGRLI